MSASVNADNAEPNLTPMLDMVFQLITFFMLVMNFKANEIDQNLKLPVVGSARPVDTTAEDQLLVLNINAQGQLIMAKQVIENVEDKLKREAQGSIMTAKIHGRDLKFGDDLPAWVVLRADQNTPFKAVNRVIRACQDNGYRNFALMALDRPAK
ncbi:MAG TPA: biopolymer transporter ExbD [Pirellulales bacterium]|jgi:biopolymer transport protein ExbD|nr:biopolymer transporter ExbD [Pirellulales bacterium]